MSFHISEADINWSFVPTCEHINYFMCNGLLQYFNLCILKIQSHMDFNLLMKKENMWAMFKCAMFHSDINRKSDLLEHFSLALARWASKQDLLGAEA